MYPTKGFMYLFVIFSFLGVLQLSAVTIPEEVNKKPFMDEQVELAE